MATTIELWIPFDGIYQPALSIPIDTCQRFSIHPLTWLRYLGFTIYGTEGHISTSPGGPEVNYYQADIQPGIYYYVSHEALLLDPDLMDDRTSDASDISTSQGNFRQRVTDRDGTCVMTGAAYFQACHIVPHAKGHRYMTNLANHRHEAVDPPLNDINDTHNGILLALQLRGPFGASEVAFLQTPNFAMTVNDVDLVTQPTADCLGFGIQPSHASSRLTFQHFNNHDLATAMLAPHNSDARQSDSNEWPPPLIFDVAYGCVALKTWGVPLFMNFARGRTRDIYYNNDVDNGDDENGEGGGDERNWGNGGDGEPDDDVSGDGQSKKRSQQTHGRNAHATRREKERSVGRQASNTADSQTPDFADMVLALWMQNARKGQRQARAMTADRTREKVRTWLDSTK